MTDDKAISVERYWQFGLRALRFGISYHALLAFVFYGVGASQLALANLGGAALFLYCTRLVRQGYFGAVMILVRVEILA